MDNFTLWGIRVGVCVFALFLCGFFLIEFAEVKGNEVGVMETFGEGVSSEPLQPKTYVLFPSFWYGVYKYDVSSRIYVMNDRGPDHAEFGEGRPKDSYVVQSSEGQDMTIAMNIRWRLDPARIVHFHRSLRTNVEEKALRPVVQKIVKDSATLRSAVEAYSGEGLVKLQAEISDHLIKSAEFKDAGIIIENFVIESIKLDDAYIGEIKKRQVAMQQELKNKQEEKAALAAAQKAKAESGADYERKVVEAERDKAVGILKAQEQAQQQILAAEAAKKKAVLAAEAEKETGELKAASIKAIGAAEAEAQKLKLSSYAVPGAEAFVKIEVAKQMAIAFQGIKGYIPENMKINVLGDSFKGAVQAVIDVGETPSGKK